MAQMEKIKFLSDVEAPGLTVGSKAVATQEYVQQEITELINSAPEALDTLGELATALEEHEDAYDALLETIGNKANKSELVVTAGTATNSAKTNTNTASGVNSFAIGSNNNAKAENQFIAGTYNKDDEDALVIIGNGTSSKRSNAFVVKKDGSVEGGGSSSDLAKEITGISVNLDPASAEGISSLAFGANSTTYGPGSVAIGANVSAGTMAYYFDNIDFTNKKITLSTTRRTLLGGTPSYPSSVAWSTGDRISIKNGDTNYIMCSTITNVSGNVITVDNLPFNDIAAAYKLGIYTLPHDRTVVDVDNPADGAVQLGFGALAVGGGKDTDTRAVGMLSTALGYETLAAGSEAFAGGYRTEAAYASLAYGHEAKALGQVSAATGRETTASGMYSSAENYQTIASGDKSHAEGYGSHAEGEDSHVEGQKSYAKGIGAHAEGFNSTGTSDRTNAGLSDTRHGAFSQGSHTEGGGCLATGGRDHAEGTLTTTTGWAAHAEGNTTTASGMAAHAEGYKTQATADYSHAGGLGTKATAVGQTVIGKYNVTDDNALFIIGNGSSSTPSNAFVVEPNGVTKINKIQVGSGSAEANNSYAGGLGSVTTNGHNEPGFENTGTTYSNDNITLQFVMGEAHPEIDDISYDYYIKISGNNDLAIGDYIEGLSCTYGYMGSYYDPETVSGVYTDRGVYFGISGDGHLHDLAPVAGETFIVRKATEVFVPHNNTFAHGAYLIADRDNQTVVGKYNAVDSSALFIVGNGTSESNRKNAFVVTSDGTAYSNGEKVIVSKDMPDMPVQKGSGIGSVQTDYSTATYNYAHAEGLDTKATNQASHAEGYNTTASGWISHAEGNNTEASGTNSHAEGQNCKATINNAHAGGLNSEANGMHSFAHGAGVIADKEGQAVVGKYNKTDVNTVFTVGAGSNSASRKNLIEAYAGTMSVNLGLDLQSSWLQTVVGGFNVATTDTNGLYRFIVGGGGSDTDRKNAMTVSKTGEVALCSGGSLKIGSTTLTEADIQKLKNIENAGNTTFGG